VSHKTEEVPQDQPLDKLVLVDLVMVMSVHSEVVEEDKEVIEDLENKIERRVK